MAVPRQESSSFRDQHMMPMKTLAAMTGGPQPAGQEAIQTLPAANRGQVLRNCKALKDGATAAAARRSSNRLFTLDMVPTQKRRRRQFSDVEKEHIKQVRKIGAA